MSDMSILDRLKSDPLVKEALSLLTEEQRARWEDYILSEVAPLEEDLTNMLNEATRSSRSTDER